MTNHDPAEYVTFVNLDEGSKAIALHPHPAGSSSVIAARSDVESFVGNRANLPEVSPGISGAPGKCQVPKMPSPELVPT